MGSQGGRIDENGCAVPWWGTPLDGATGLRECPGPYDPAILAYGQTNIPPCSEVTGPIDQKVSAEGQLSCCYHIDEHACCSTFEADRCIDVPYFGDGTRVAELPTTPVAEPSSACAELAGDPLELTTFEAANELVGVWLACAEMPPQWQGNGFIFQGDGSFHSISRGQDGLLVEAEGCLQAGLWGLLPETGQLNLHFGDRTQIVHPEFIAGAGARLVLRGYGYEFVRAAAATGG